MGAEPFDSLADDALQAFGSETSMTPTQDQEPAFMRTPAMSEATTFADARHSIFSADHSQPQTSRAWPVAVVSVVFGVIAGFAAGYAVAHRGVVPSDVPTSARGSSVNSQSPLANSSPQPTRGSDVVATAPEPDATIASVPATPSSTTPEPRTALDLPTTSGSSQARSTDDEPRVPRTSRVANNESRLSGQRPAPLVQAAGSTGTIEVQSHPGGAQVLLDGSVIGQAPLSIPGVAAGTHEIRIELAGFNPWVTSVRVSGGSRARVGASLAP